MAQPRPLLQILMGLNPFIYEDSKRFVAILKSNPIIFMPGLSQSFPFLIFYFICAMREYIRIY